MKYIGKSCSSCASVLVRTNAVLRCLPFCRLALRRGGRHTWLPVDTVRASGTTEREREPGSWLKTKHIRSALRGVSLAVGSVSVSVYLADGLEYR